MIYGCFGDSTTGPGADKDIRFPLAVGNEWIYRCSYTLTTITAADSTHESSGGEVTWKVAARENLLGQDSYRMEFIQKVTSGTDSGNVVQFNCWYAERDSELVAIANDSTAGHAPFLYGQLFKPAATRSEIYEWGVTVLQYPYVPGTRWLFFSSVWKSIEARERITVNGRKFDTFRVVRDDDTTGDPQAPQPYVFRSIEWFASEGLVKSTMAATAYSDSSTIIESYVQELVSFNLK